MNVNWQEHPMTWVYVNYRGASQALTNPMYCPGLMFWDVPPQTRHSIWIPLSRNMFYGPASWLPVCPQPEAPSLCLLSHLPPKANAPLPGPHAPGARALSASMVFGGHLSCRTDLVRSGTSGHFHDMISSSKPKLWTTSCLLKGHP